MTKIVYSFDRTTGFYTGRTALNDSDLSPLEPGVYLIPGDALEEAPPTGMNQRAKAVNGEWVLEDIPAPYEAPVVPPLPQPEPIVFDPASFLTMPMPRKATAEDDQSRLMNGVQKYMDTIAQAFGYDSVATAVTYAEEPAVPKFQQEGKAFRAWRSRVWAMCYQIQEEVLSGQRSVPDEQQLIALLPQFENPQEEQQG